jgi:hypothetical protein
MNNLIKVLVLLPAVLFVFTGLRWLVDPGGVAPGFGFTLETGLGLSSQVGDLSAFFLTLGGCMLIGLVSGRGTWYYPAMMLLGIAAIGRTLAWLIHDAALAPQIVVEVIVVVILLVAVRRLPTGP